MSSVYVFHEGAVTIYEKWPSLDVYPNNAYVFHVDLAGSTWRQVYPAAPNYKEIWKLMSLNDIPKDIRMLALLAI